MVFVVQITMKPIIPIQQFFIFFFIQSLPLRIYCEHFNVLKCKPIQYEACKNVGYNYTSLPNLVGLELESEIKYSLDTFKPLVNFGCSSRLQFLLCSIYVPMCSFQVSTLIGPCRPLCENVKERCESVLRGFGYPWPSTLNCSKLPLKNDERHMCMDGPGEAVYSPPMTTSQDPPGSSCAHFTQPHIHVYLNATGRCAPLCGAHVAFSQHDKMYAGVWLSIWSLPTILTGLFIVCSLLLDPSLFKYPDRASVYVCLCYTFVATGYLFRMFSGSISCKKDPELGVNVAITEGVITTPCVTVFILLYYFNMAAGVWWIIHNACWFLKAWVGMTHQHFVHHSSFLHILGWGLPSSITILCLILKKIEADELTGTCYAGGHESYNLAHWIIIPSFLFLIIGTTFIVLSFACFWRSRTFFSQNGLPYSHVDISVARIGVMAILYMIPSTCNLGCVFYEMSERHRWVYEIGVHPHVEVFMLKIFMSMAPGLLLGMFLINSEVVNSWKKFLRRIYSICNKSRSGHTQTAVSFPIKRSTNNENGILFPKELNISAQPTISHPVRIHSDAIYKNTKCPKTRMI